MRIKLFEQFVNEKMAHVNIHDFADRVADAYEALPDYDEKAIPSYEALNKSNHKLFKQIESKYKVEFVDEDPYSTAEEMRREAEDTGVLKIYKGDSEHQYFSPEDNWIFRAVHDYYTHIITKTENFDLRGELRAYNTHAKLVPPAALPALFTEVVGQVCYYIKKGEFAKQKVAIMDGFDFKNVGEFT